MRRLSEALIGFFNQFFYPAFCLHCNYQIFGKEKWICKTCFDHIEWIDIKLVCQICGRPKRDRIQLKCKQCQTSPSYLMPFCSCFFPEGPAYSLHEYLRIYESEDIAKIFASLLVLKWKMLMWPLPDVIVPIPNTRLTSISLKKQPNYLVAKMLSKLLVRPFKSILTTYEQGTNFNFRTRTFCKGNLVDQTVLLITDMVNDNDKMRFARDAICSLFPKTTYILALFDRRI